MTNAKGHFDLVYACVFTHAYTRPDPHMEKNLSIFGEKII